MDAPQIWADYVRAVVAMTTPGADQTTIAKKAGTTQGTISRWMGGRYLPDKAAPVAAFAQAYGRNVLEAFVAAGMLDEETAGRGLPASSVWFLRSLSDPGDGLPAVADTSPIEGPGEDSI